MRRTVDADKARRIFRVPRAVETAGAGEAGQPVLWARQARDETGTRVEGAGTAGTGRQPDPGPAIEKTDAPMEGPVGVNIRQAKRRPVGEMAALLHCRR